MLLEVRRQVAVVATALAELVSALAGSVVGLSDAGSSCCPCLPQLRQTKANYYMLSFRPQLQSWLLVARAPPGYASPGPGSNSRASPTTSRASPTTSRPSPSSYSSTSFSLYLIFYDISCLEFGFELRGGTCIRQRFTVMRKDNGDMVCNGFCFFYGIRI